MFPVFEYTHSQGCSVTGGYRYRGSALPSMQGAYLFADYCNNTIRVLSLTGNTATEISSVKVSPQPIVSFGQDANGELYVLSFDGASLPPRSAAGSEDGLAARRANDATLRASDATLRANAL